MFGLKHKLPHGKVKIFKKYAFQFSHFIWAKKTIKEYFHNKTENYIFTRSDWIAFFAAKKGNKVIFECHQRSRTRDFVVSQIGNLQNVTIIFLNENLRIYNTTYLRKTKAEYDNSNTNQYGYKGNNKMGAIQFGLENKINSKKDSYILKYFSTTVTVYRRLVFFSSFANVQCNLAFFLKYIRTIIWNEWSSRS